MMPSQPPPPEAPTKEKKRALPTEFERQVQQIRCDILTVRANLDAAERALQGIPPSGGEIGEMSGTTGSQLMETTAQQTSQAAHNMLNGTALQGDLMVHQRHEEQ